VLIGTPCIPYLLPKFTPQIWLKAGIHEAARDLKALEKISVQQEKKRTLENRII